VERLTVYRVMFYITVDLFYFWTYSQRIGGYEQVRFVDEVQRKLLRKKNIHQCLQTETDICKLRIQNIKSFKFIALVLCHCIKEEI